MKVAASVVNEKKLQLMPLDNLKQVTGYIRGGCSPVGMKHLFPTTMINLLLHAKNYREWWTTRNSNCATT